MIKIDIVEVNKQILKIKTLWIMDIKHLSYQEFLGVNPCDLMHPEKPQIFCVHNAKLSPSAARKITDPSVMSGLLMRRGNVYVFCSSTGDTLYEQDIFQDILMIDFTKSLEESNMHIFSKIVSLLVPRHL